MKTGLKEPRSTSLSVEEEAIIIALRQHTLLPLDDCLYALQATIPRLTRSSLHRCLQRHGVSRLTEVEGDKTARAKFKSYPIGYFNIDIAEVRTAEGNLYLFVAIDRTFKFAFVQLHQKATTRVAGDFLRALVEAVPYNVHTVLTDNGTHFTDPKGGAWTTAELKNKMASGERHLANFVDAYNFVRRLKTLRGLTPFEFDSKRWTTEPHRFNLNPLQQMPGLNI